MSGPKSVSYSVSSGAAAAGAAVAAGAAAAEAAAAARAAERERRRIRREQLQARGEALSRELNRVAEQWREAGRQYGGEFPAWPHGEAAPDSAPAHRRLDALEDLVDDLAQRVAQARQDYARQSTWFKMRTSLQAASQIHAAGSQSAERAAEEERAQRQEQEVRQCAEDVARLLGTLAAEASDGDRAEIEKRAEETAAAAGAARRKALLLQLRLDVQRANAAAETRRRVAGRVEQWRGRLAGLEGPSVQELDRDLRRLVEGGAPAVVPPDMEQRVDSVVAGAAEASDRGYALSVIAEELENLGYVVETGFDTASAQAPDMLLRKPDMADDYHVSLRAEAGAPLLQARVVREADDADDDPHAQRSAEREETDRDVERAWCGDLAAALAAAEHRGVHGRVASRHAAGEVPVSTIAPLKTGAEPKAGRRRKRATRLRSRSVR